MYLLGKNLKFKNGRDIFRPIPTAELSRLETHSSLFHVAVFAACLLSANKRTIEHKRTKTARSSTIKSRKSCSVCILHTFFLPISNFSASPTFLVPSYCSLFIHDDFLTMTFFYPFDHVMQKEFDVYYNTSVKPPIVSALFSREIHMPKAVLISFRWIKALFISHKNNKRIKKHQYKRDFTQLFFVAHKWSITNEKKNKIL